MTCQAFVLGALLSIVFINDRPFMGQTSVGPDAMLKAIKAIDQRRD